MYGDVWLEVSPNEVGGGYVWENAIVGGSIPREFIKPTEEGVKEAIQNGISAGFPIVDVKVKLYDGSFHEVDSNEMAFKIAGSMGFQAAARQADPIILEPIMKVEVVVAEEFMGDVIGDLNSKRGRIESMEDRSGAKVIDAKVPLAEMFGYATAIRSLSKGRASYTMEPSHFEQVPAQIVAAVLDQKGT